MEHPIGHPEMSSACLEPGQTWFDGSAMLEDPVLVYNANIYIENVRPEWMNDHDMTTELTKASNATRRKLKNGCVEVVDASTGCKTRFARERSYGLLMPLDALADAFPEESSDFDLQKLLSLLNDDDRSSEFEDAELSLSNVLHSTCIANTPFHEKRHELDSTSLLDLPNGKRMRYGENASPMDVDREEPFVMDVQNVFVLNKEVIHKRNGQTGYCGNVEKVRVEMDSLEDGYKWRKYGRKAVKGNTYPRSYFKCTYPECTCRKQVEQNPKNPRKLIASYEGRHIHPPPFIAHRTKSNKR